MAVDLTWIRDKYDTNNNRYIDDNEVSLASYDIGGKKITQEQYDAVVDAWSKHTSLPIKSGVSTISGGTTTKAAKGKIVNFNYPTTAKTNERVAIRAAVQNTGNASGIFKVQLMDGDKILRDGCTVTSDGYLLTRDGRKISPNAYKISQTTSFTVAAGGTSSTKTMYVTTPSSGSGVNYQLWCTRLQ